MAGPAGPRGAVVSWAAMKSASLTSAGCAGWREMTQPSGRFHRCTCLCPSPVLAGSTRSKSVRCRFHTSRPVYRGFARIAATVRSVHPAPLRCGFRPGSAADGHGIPASPARASAARDLRPRRQGRLPPASTAECRSGRTAAPSTRTGSRRTPARTPRSRSRPTPRLGSANAATGAAACGRRGHGSSRLCPASKSSAVIRPRTRSGAHHQPQARYPEAPSGPLAARIRLAAPAANAVPVTYAGTPRQREEPSLNHVE